MSTEAAPPKPLHAPLDEYVRQFEDLERDARQLTEGLNDNQLNWSPAPGRWSMAQCFDHLNCVARGYADALADGIEKAGEQGLRVRGPVRYSFIERWMIRSMEPPPRRRLPAPARFRPAEPRHIFATFWPTAASFVGALGAHDRAIEWRRKGCRSLGGGTVIRFP